MLSGVSLTDLKTELLCILLSVTRGLRSQTGSPLLTLLKLLFKTLPCD